MSTKKRLEALEGDHAAPEEDLKTAEKRLKDIREGALHANRCQDRDEAPLFDVSEAGVFCARDGRPVVDAQQILAERFYTLETTWGGSGLDHDQEAEAFYTLEGELALSRTLFTSNG